MTTTITSMRRLLVVVGTAPGIFYEQWKDNGQCMSDTSDKVECALEHGIDEKLVN